MIWKNLNVEYKAALTRYTMSGTHWSNFYEFCHGRHDIYYLRKHLEAKPNLYSTVAADLPEEVRLNSTGRQSSRLSSAGSTSAAKHKGDKSEVIDLLYDIQADCKCKKTKDDHWTEKEESVWREKRSAKQGKKSAQRRNTSTVNGNMSG